MTCLRSADRESAHVWMEKWKKKKIKNNDLWICFLCLCTIAVQDFEHKPLYVSSLPGTQSAILHDQYQSISQHWLYNYREVKSVTHSHVEALTDAASGED